MTTNLLAAFMYDQCIKYKKGPYTMIGRKKNISKYFLKRFRKYLTHGSILEIKKKKKISGDRC